MQTYCNNRKGHRAAPISLSNISHINLSRVAAEALKHTHTISLSLKLSPASSSYACRPAVSMTTVKTVAAASPLRHGTGGAEVVNDPSIVHPKTAPPPSPPPPHARATLAPATSGRRKAPMSSAINREAHASVATEVSSMD
jgi:hypothetical protein